MRYTKIWMSVLMIIASTQLAGCAGTRAAANTSAPARADAIAGSPFKRVILTEKAAERLGIEAAEVRLEQTSRTRKVGGRLVPARSAAIAGTASAAGAASGNGPLRVELHLSEGERKLINRDLPVRIRPIDVGSDDDADAEWMAEDDSLDAGDSEDADNALYYALDSADQRLTPGQGVLVELPLAAPAVERKVIPYAAVAYGLKGETWVYTNPEPLVFVRQPVVIDYIQDNKVFLSEGPPAGTKVVTSGGAELLGVELGVGK